MGRSAPSKNPNARAGRCAGKRPPHTLALAAVFTLHVLALLVVSVGASLLLLRALMAFGIFTDPRPEALLVVMSITSVVLGVGMSRIAGKDVLTGVVETSRAAERVAAGDFSVRLDFCSRAREVNSLAENFNIMASELEHTEILRSDFISSVSHEFKTPLSTIEGYATLLQSPHLSEAQRRLYTDKIIHSAKRLSNLTGSVLELTRLENSELHLERAPFALDEQIREALLYAEDAWSKKSIDLQIELGELTFSGNADLLAHVWQNLIDNAVKYSHPGGTVRVSLARAFGANGLEAVVRVADEGIGMTPEEVERAFEKFYQGDASRSGEGAGLGLALSKKIVDMHGGTIGVESSPQVGSTFEVHLPM